MNECSSNVADDVSIRSVQIDLEQQQDLSEMLGERGEFLGQILWQGFIALNLVAVPKASLCFFVVVLLLLKSGSGRCCSASTSGRFL